MFCHLINIHVHVYMYIIRNFYKCLNIEDAFWSRWVGIVLEANIQFFCLFFYLVVGGIDTR